MSEIQTAQTNQQAYHKDQAFAEVKTIKVVGKLPLHKAAEPDRLRREFFKASSRMWAAATASIMDAISQTTSKISTCLTKPIIALQHKKSSRYRFESYTLIALVNVLAKIESKVHSNRLKLPLAYRILKSQTGFVTGRTATKNIIMTYDIMHWSNRHCSNAMLLSLDFVKAYGRVQWSLLLAFSQRMRFGSVFYHFVSK